MRRILTMTLTIALAVAGASAAAAQDTEPGADEASDVDDMPMVEAPAPPAEGTAIATIGDTTWEFVLDGDARVQCNPDFGGFFFAVLFGQDEDGQETVLSIQADPAGTRAGVQIGLTTIPGALWIADPNVYISFPDLEEGVGATVTIDGASATGTGVFYDDRSLQEARQTGGAYEAGLMPGSFAVTCPAL